MPLLDEAGHALRVLLNSTELKTGPIALVCHSLGGLLAKSIVRAAKEQSSSPEIASFYERVRQVVFIATPHTGAGKATLLAWLSWLSWPSASARNLVANRPELRDLNFGYRTLVEDRKGNLTHLVYYEMMDTLAGGIVSPASADPGLPNCRPIPVRENHITIAKPIRRDELIYVESLALVARLAPRPGNPGVLRTYTLEPFKLEWSWSHLLPKLIRVAAVGLLVFGAWKGVPWVQMEWARWQKAATQIDDTSVQMSELLRRTAQAEGVPLDALRAILVDMGKSSGARPSSSKS
jgi:hypothetical protein